MNDFETLMKFPPNSVADVLRRLLSVGRDGEANAPLLTLHLTSGVGVAGALLQFRKDNSHQFVVTLGNFRSEDGAVESVSYVPLGNIVAVTVHHPIALASFLSEAPMAEEEIP
jgi:hypothetical protein